MASKSILRERRDEKSRDLLAGLPRRDSSTANSGSANEKLATSTTRKTEQPLIKILVCNDDLAEHTLLRTYLKRIAGREVVLLKVGCSGEIQDALRKRRIDLVLMDEQMPRKPGMEWLAGVSKKQLAPVVMLSESETQKTTSLAFQKGVVAYLPKRDLTPEKLDGIINAALDKWTRLQQAKADREELERLVAFDSVTGLYNRRAILGRLRELINLANRYKEDLSLVILDIDHLKLVNDRYGHLTGDEVLEKIATLIRCNTRETDAAGRYGGDEFIITLPRTNLSSAWVIAERLRSMIEKAEMKDFAGTVFGVTVSQGLAGCEPNEDTSSLISRVDEALYKSKEKGPNRVQILLGPSLRDKV